MKPPVEAKVKAGTGGAAAGSALGVAIAAFVVYELGATVYHGVVPAPVTDLVMLAVPLAVGAAGSYIAGWLAPHTMRPDLQAQVPDPSGRSLNRGVSGGGGVPWRRRQPPS